MILICSIVDELTLIGRPVEAASMTSGFSEAGLSKSSPKCSIHLFRNPSISLIDLPSLFITGRPSLLNFPASFFVSYRSLMFFSLTAFYSVIISSSTYIFLSDLMLLFTCLLVSVYSTYDLALSTLLRLLLVAVFVFFLTSVLYRVSTEINYL